MSAQASAFAEASLNSSNAPAAAAVFRASGGLTAAINAATLAQSGQDSSAGSAAVQATVPSVSGVNATGAYWRWIAMLGFTALVGLPCFKNPKRAHNN